MSEKTEDLEMLNDILSDIQSDERVQKMKGYTQHGRVSTYEHCENVARLSYKINKMLALNADLKTMLVGAMLHDFYLYDWHDKDDGSHRLHGFTHADKACGNAKKYFSVDEDTAHVISSHMWPLNISHVPSSKEAWVVCIADKCVSLHETLFRRKEENGQKREDKV